MNSEDTWSHKYINGYIPKIPISYKFRINYYNMMFIIALLAAIPGTIGIYTIIRYRKGEKITLYGICFRVLFGLLWIGYGMLLQNITIIISFSITTLTSIISSIVYIFS